MIVSANGLGGIVTCDLVVDSTGIAVDCSQWSSLFNGACWNPLAPCAQQNSTPGQPATVDNSLSQLGPVGAWFLETDPNGGNTFLGIGSTIWLIAGIGLVTLLVI